jgi:hypothetical protein
MPNSDASWIAAQIEARSPIQGTYMPRQAVQDLLDGCSFLDGRSGQVFGMVAQVDAEDVRALRAACTTQLMRWLDHFASNDQPSQVVLFDAMKGRGMLPPNIAEPALSELRRRNRAELERALGALPSPVEAVARMWPGEAVATRALVGLLADDFEAVLRAVLPDDLPSEEEYILRTRDDWRVGPAGCSDPAVLALAGLDDFGIGLCVDRQLIALDAGVPVVAYYGDGEANRWVCQGASHALEMARTWRAHQGPDGARSPRDPQRGVEHPAIAECLARRARRVDRPWTWQGTPEATLAGLAASRAYEAAGDTFAAIHVRANMIARRIVMREFDGDVADLTRGIVDETTRDPGEAKP